MSPLIITAALLLLVSAAAPAASPTAAVAAAGVKASAKTGPDYWNQVVCEDRPYVGSRFIRHICLTRLQRYYQHQRLDTLERRMGEGVGLPPEGNSIPSN